MIRKFIDSYDLYGNNGKAPWFLVRVLLIYFLGDFEYHCVAQFRLRAGHGKV